MEKIYEEIREKVQARYPDAEVTLDEVVNVNATEIKLTIMYPDKAITPVIAIEKMEPDDDIDEIVEQIAEIYDKASEKPPIIDTDAIATAEYIEENAFPCLVNTALNAELLKTIPHREFLDLSIIYRIKVRPTGVVLITNSLADTVGLSEDDLFAITMENQPRITNPSVKSMRAAILDMGMDPDRMPQGPDMLVIRTEMSQFGAAAILDERVQEKLNRLGDLYILPSSMHELLAIPKNASFLRGFKETVSDANSSTVLREDFLSDSVYEYSNGILSIVA